MDIRKLEQLVEEQAANLRLFAAMRCQDPDDCVQNAFAKLACQKEAPKAPVAWLFRVVRNEAIDQQRAAFRRKNREQIAAARRPLFNNGQHEIDTDDLHQALQSLNETDREIVIARVWGELNFEELSELAGCSSSAAHRRYKASIEHLRELLGLTWLIKK